MEVEAQDAVVVDEETVVIKTSAANGKMTTRAVSEMRVNTNTDLETIDGMGK